MNQTRLAEVFQSVRTATFEETNELEPGNRYHNCPEVVTDEDDKALCIIAAGRSDDVTVWREGAGMVVLSVNRSMGYCGLQVLESDDDGKAGSWGEVGSVFFQNADEALDNPEGSGDDGEGDEDDDTPEAESWRDLSEVELRDLLWNYCEC